ncbi:MAG: glutamate formimidoyltransferase [Saprospirales bacterium]|nr:glutamate formimidoyltransferase [Saprospirales bacterium]MBK8921989.1 glutamate formimidoyltransferase [Saprospirales bacterium]
MKQLIECVPNFSEGRDPAVIKQITDAVERVEGVKLLDVDPGKATNRTVVTFVGEPGPVVEAAFQAIRLAAELIDMRRHTGEHPRMGATDVCPLIPVSNISMEETAGWARRLGERVGCELDIPVYLYEAAASRPERRNLAAIRAGEYEALPEKLTRPEWAPDFGPARFHAKCGATVIGARDFLIAYNLNLNTTSTRRANSVAFDVREIGRVIADPTSGKPVVGPDGEPQRQPGTLKGVKAIGWFIEEYGIAQISMNITDTRATPLYRAFEECCKSAERRGMRVTGSELVGLVPLDVLLEAGRYFLKKQQRSAGVSTAELIRIAVKSMGLDELAPFDSRQKIIEYNLAKDDPATAKKLIRKDLEAFADETAAESPAPGGGSVSAYVGALGVSLATMVANLSAHKRGWDERWEAFSDAAEQGQRLKDALLRTVDEDTDAFNAILTAFGLPKGTPEEKAARKAAIEQATLGAIEVPLRVLRLGLECLPLIRQMVDTGNPNSITDAGVGALCARAAVLGAALNVKVNASGLNDKDYAARVLAEADAAMAEAGRLESEILAVVREKMGV